MTYLRDLTGFRELNTLKAKHNLIDNMDDLTATISTLTSLKDMSLRGNPVVRSYRYRENLIANSVSLGKFIYVDRSLPFLSRSIAQSLLCEQLVSTEKW